MSTGSLCKALGALVVCLAASVVADVASARSAWDAYVAGFIEKTFTAYPQFGVWSGRHEFDGKLPDWSRAGLRKEAARLHAARERAAAFDDAALSQSERFERANLLAIIDGQLFQLETVGEPWRNPTYYAWALDPNVYVTREYAPLAQRMRAYVSYANAIPAAARQMRANLRTPLPASFVRVGRIGAGGLAAFYQKDVPAVFAAVDDPRLQKAFRDANARAIRAMKDLDAWFAKEERRATQEFALGPQKFVAMLKAGDRLDVPLDRLKEIAERDLARNVAALHDACDAIAQGQPVEACVAKVQADKPADAPAEARRQLDDVLAFLERGKLVSIPDAERPRVADSPPYQRWNAAYIDIPGPYEKRVPATYYIAPPDPKWVKAERDAYVPGRNDLLFISVHEVWPGHFLQFLHAKHSPTPIGRLFWNYAFMEGWAHYAEEMMWDAGLGDGDPSVHVGQLLNALMRNVRLVCAIGLHTAGMSVAQCEALFRDKAYVDAGNARQQADRGTFDPGYGAYTLGKLMIRKLRDDWTATRGGREAWQPFHDALLARGAAPVPLLRKAMLGDEARPPL